MRIPSLASALCLLTVLSCGESTDTADVDLAGSVAKGPFVVGSSVSVSPLDASGNPTGDVFKTQTTSDRGDFDVVVGGQGLLALEADGFYYNEVSGRVSSAPITLRALYELGAADAQTAHINLVTHLAAGRVKTLIANGETTAAAITQAEAELHGGLGIGVATAPGANGTDLDILGGDTFANAYLFAMSAVIAKHTEGGGDGAMQEFLNRVELDLAPDGILDSATTDALDEAESELNPDEVMNLLEVRLEDIASTAVVPDLHQVLDTDSDGAVNRSDNCRYVANSDQLDGDDNGQGDVCDAHFSQVAHGYEHGCGITATGQVKCWAGTTPDPDAFGIGDPSVAPPGSMQFSDITASRETTCGIRTDQTVHCWKSGSADYDIALPDAASKFLTVDPYASPALTGCALRTDGAIDCWQNSVRNTHAGPFTDFATLTNGNVDDVCAILQADGSISCFDPFTGTPSTARTPPPGSFVVISGRTFSGCALSATNGSVHCFGLDDFESHKPTGTGFSELAVADNDACVLKTGEVPICWSSNGPGLELTNVPTVPVHGLAAGDMNIMCALDADGAAICWGGVYDLP
jgi:hypothetical protein